MGNVRSIIAPSQQASIEKMIGDAVVTTVLAGCLISQRRPDLNGGRHMATPFNIAISNIYSL